MSDKTKTKRKLIGFVAGERGSISKVKALALGASIAGAASLSEAEARLSIDSGWSGDGWDNSWDNSWSGDSWDNSWSGDTWTDEGWGDGEGGWWTHEDGDRWVNNWPDDTIGNHTNVHTDTGAYDDTESRWADDSGDIIPGDQADWDDTAGSGATWDYSKSGSEKSGDGGGGAGIGNGGWNNAGWDDAWDDWSGDWSNAPPKVEKVE